MVQINFGTLDQAQNFWELNPQMRIYRPFSKLYNEDSSKKKEFSSRQMWTIFFMCDPDPEKNIFFRMTEEERKEALSETFVSDLDWKDPVFVECLEAYPFECMTAIERSLAQEKEKLRERAKLIKNTELTLDRTELIGDKAVNIKGTAKQIHDLQKDIGKIYDEYERIEQKFMKQKEVARARGGDKLTKAEKGELW